MIPPTSAAEPSLSANEAAVSASEAHQDFGSLYEEHFPFVWRNLHRLGVPPALVPDAAQDVFLVVFRKLDQYEPRGSLRAWLFAIVASIARTHRRTLSRKGISKGGEPDAVCDEGQPDPHDMAERSEAVALLVAILSSLDDELREVLVLFEFEQMTAPEVGQALGINPNTAYSRLRAARRDFDAAMVRLQSRYRWTP